VELAAQEFVVFDHCAVLPLYVVTLDWEL